MRWTFFALALVLTMHASGADRLYSNKEVESGLKLSEADARKIEKKVLSGKGNASERMRLLAWYTTRIDLPEASEIRAKRIPQILWFVTEAGAYVRPYDSICVATIHRDGDAFADKAGYEQVKAAWLERLAREPSNSVVADQTARFMYPEEPEEAFRIAVKAGHALAAGELTAKYLLGVARVRYDNCKVEKTIPRTRETETGQVMMNSVAQSSVAVFLSSFASTLARYGSEAYSKGRLDWDYTPLANDARSRALKLLPEESACWSERYSLPKPGEAAAPATPGLNVEQARMVKQPKPAYPPEAKAQRIQGKVQFDALIGCSGNVIWLRIIDGPDVFVLPSYAAVRQWVYEPLRIDGRPTETRTVIDVNYSLQY